MDRPYAVYVNGKHADESFDLSTAIQKAESIFSNLSEGTPVTIKVENPDGYLLAVMSNRRIEGVIHRKYVDGTGPSGEVSYDEIHIDATSVVLSLAHSQFQELADETESTKQIARQSPHWTGGPCHVSLVASVCTFFDVSSLAEVTPDALGYALLHTASEYVEETVFLEVKVKVRRARVVPMSDFIENLDYSIVSQTRDITVLDTEIIG